ncbi:MAG: family 20 glycosylhydrolase, partial [Flavobacteriaceae bacterium]|nr:family 20 glycosylhydrolase [Flavobacteriaceae bacterium]
ELSKEEAKYVLGAQGNVWTEYITTPEKVEYMAFPRAIALSEVLWSTPENKNYDDFKNRLIQYQKRLDMLKVNYANHLYEIKGELINNDGNLSYSLKTEDKSYKIVYSIDGSNPKMLLYPEYEKPIKIDSSITIKAAVFDFDSEKQLGEVFEQKIEFHKAIGKKVSLSVEPSLKYNAGGKEALINGISGNNKRYGDKEWLGFDGKDVIIKIDLGEKTVIKSISMRFHNGNGQWIYAPKRIEIKVDGTDKFMTKQLTKSTDLLVNFNAEINATTRFITIKVINYGVIPDGKQGAGHRAWLFIDEIIVE